MKVLKAIFGAIGRFFARIGRWIKETAWVQPLLIVGGIFAIIFSIPYLTKWVKSWFNDESASEKYYSSKKVKLDNAEDHNSDVDKLFDFLESYSEGKADEISKGKAKWGDKFFLTLVQESCSSCEDRYGGFKTLEDNWNSGSLDGLDGKFKFYTIYVDTKNNDGDNLFEKVYERDTVNAMFEETISYMSGEFADHPYKDNSGESSYTTSLESLTNREEISTPTTFLIDLTDSAPDWTSPHGVREVLFSFDGIGGSDNIAKARTLHHAWINDAEGSGSYNIFSPEYKK